MSGFLYVITTHVRCSEYQMLYRDYQMLHWDYQQSDKWNWNYRILTNDQVID